MMTQPTYAMRLDALLPQQAAGSPCAGLEVTGITNDSRRVQPGDLFLAYAGMQYDGKAFVDAAIQAGASAVVADQIVEGIGVPLLVVPELASRLPELAAAFYRTPAQSLDLVGITGTNGKTSCCHFIAQALSTDDVPAAMIGTNGYGFYGQLEAASHTTPDAIRLQQLLAQLRDAGAEQVVMEVSSHALEQRRVAGLRFSQAVLTNLSRDHLDYHGTMEAYGAAKLRLFHEYGVQQAIVNVDDPFGRQLVENLPEHVDVISFGLDSVADLSVSRYEASPQGIRAQLKFQGGEAWLGTPLIGRFSLLNLLAAGAVLLGRGWVLAAVADRLAGLAGVAGRMESVSAEGRPLVVIDYAHTPDALEKALQALRPHCSGQVWCVFGCGGDRDRGKRPQMAAAVSANADQVVVTSDNPRSEAPEAIIEDILRGLNQSSAIVVEPDRGRAIRYAIDSAAPQDVVLVAGKGHEDYQEVHGVRYPFSDAQQVRVALGLQTEVSVQ